MAGIILTSQLQASHKKYVIAVGKSNDITIEFWHNLTNGLTSGAEDFNINYEYMVPEKDENYISQISTIDNAIAKKPDMIILISADYENIKKSAERITDSGIKLLSLDSDVNYDKKSMFIGTDNLQAGRLAGEFMTSSIKENKKAIVLSQMYGTKSADDRLHGFLQTFSQTKNIYNCFASQDNAYKIVKALIDESSYVHDAEVGGFFAINEVVAKGAAKAISDLGKQDEIVLIAFDSSQEIIKYIESGVISKTLVQKPFNMGYLAMQYAKDILEQKSHPKVYDTGVVFIDKSNMYTVENQKLLFPFE